MVMFQCVDWDWYVRFFSVESSSSIVPEVGRTFHEGFGGYHTSGWEQYYFFDKRPLNTDPNARVNVNE